VEISEKAQALHDKAILIDGHNDSIIEHWARKESMDMTPDLPDYQVDLRRMRAGGLTAMNSMVGGGDLFQCIELWDGMYEHIENHPDDYLIVDTADDIYRAKREGKIGLIGQLESCTALGRSLRPMRVMHKLGVRVANLTHGEAEEDSLHGTKSPFDFCELSDRQRARKDFQGLTDFGREAIPEINRLGMVVDLAHTQDASYFEAIDLSEAPVMFSHGNVFGLSPHWRNLTDDQLRALADNGGVIGLAFLPEFLARDPGNQTLDRLVDHIEYVCDLIGDDYVGFGADYDGMGKRVAIPPSYAETPQVTQLMLDRGFSEETILKFWGGNFLRVITEAQGAAG